MTTVGEGLAANLATEASKCLFILAKHHVGYCFHFKKHVTDFQTELENLESTRDDALESEIRARENNEEITDVSKNWLGKAKDLIDAAEKLKAKTEEQSKCVIRWCPNYIHQNCLGKQLESRKVVYDQLWKALQDDQKLRVGVYPMGDQKVDVCTSLECQLNIELLVLTKENSWKLFQKYENITDDPSIPLDLAREAASECKGLPVAIAIVFKAKESREWKYALRTLKDVKPAVVSIDEHLT
ncbi:hypothetical protein L6164_024017 [Bauhinia variegata]|uniref:Uncharacterized protein n=1 Tax=Bauhinia variegata TaxID=167791 RepID=A0ACB9LW73_BAUVA|nr:hypothetical protein L6164_024017 [Bauhinia variegata]